MASNKAIYAVTTTYGMSRDMIFTESNEVNSHTYINVVNSRTGEYQQIRCHYDGAEDFIVVCEIWIKEYFGKHLVGYKLKERRRAT